MLKNNRIYLKHHINESIVLDENDKRGSTELKQFAVSIANLLLSKSISPTDPKWVIHHMDWVDENNKVSNIALMTDSAHKAFSNHMRASSPKYTRGREGLKDWLRDLEKDENNPERAYLTQVIIMDECIEEKLFFNLNKN